MNSQNPFFTALIAIAGVLGGLLVLLSVLLSHGNSLAHLCFYLLIAGGIAGLLVPRAAFFFWIVICGYSDMLKRAMVVFDDVSKTDLIYVLGIAPVMFLGITISLLLGALTGARRVTGAHVRLLAAGMLLMPLTGLLAAQAAGGGVMIVVQAMANSGLYGLLLFVVPVLFPRPVEMAAVLRFSTWVFLPVALYGVVQKWQGFLPFEVAYLLTGLSIEIKQLVHNEVRAFSTLNSPTALSNLSAAMVAVCWFLARIPRGTEMARRARLSPLTAFILMAAYTGALVASTGRAGVAVLVIAPLAAWCFLTPGRTRFFYAGLVGLFLALVVVSPWVLEHLEEGQLWVGSKVESGTFAGQLSSVGTYSDRLFGFVHVLRNPAAYSAFGIWDGNYDTLPETMRHHDILSEMLLRFGYIPLLLGIAVLAWLLREMHGSLHRVEAEPVRRLMAACLGLSLSFICSSCLAGSILGVFPLNAFFWMWAGTAFLCTLPAPAPAESVRTSGLDFESLAGRTPGAHRFGHRRAAQ